MIVQEDQNLECPLCMEPFEMDDVNFFPCTCGYQICRFCWHRIRTDENGLCPACRKQYPEDPADFKPLSVEEWQKIKNEKRQKDQLKKQKMSESRKHLANVRVVQKNLVFVVGLPARLADPEVLKKHGYFGKFGKIHKVVVNQSTTYAGSQGPSASAYVTYCRPEDTLRAIKTVNNIQVDGRTLKASLGTTKYCSHFLKNQQCPKTDCMYLHELGDEAASFTKEDMQQGKHQEYEKKLQDQILGSNNSINRKQTVSPTPQISTSSSKESWPCTVQTVKESRTRTKDSSQSQKTEGKSNRFKNKHTTEGQKSKKSKNKSSESVQSNSVSQSSPKEENSAQKKSHKNKYKESTSAQSSGHSPVQRLETVHRSSSPCETTSDLSEINHLNAQTTFVHITDQQNQSNPISASIKIARSESPVLPPSPISSSSSLFTPFGSLSSNFLSSSSPSPPPSNVNTHSFGNLGSSQNLQEDIPPNESYAAPSIIENKGLSPNHLYGNNLETESLFSHRNFLKSSECHTYNGHLHSEEPPNSDNSDWNSTYNYEEPQKQLPEDDLDFDPWNESSKGLAVLMAKEAGHNPPTYSELQTPPGFFQPIKAPVPNQQRISVPPPGFCTRQVPQTNSLNHLAGMYNPSNTDFISCKLPARQTISNSSYYQQEHFKPDITNQYRQQYPPQITHECLMESLQKSRAFEEHFKETIQNLNSRNMQKMQNQNGPTWNNQRREVPWLANENPLLNSANLADRNNAQIWVKALQQLSMEDNTNQFNSHSSFVNPFALRGQWPTAQCPPPGFVAPNRSPVNTPFQHMQVNQKI